MVALTEVLICIFSEIKAIEHLLAILGPLESWLLKSCRVWEFLERFGEYNPVLDTRLVDIFSPIL